MSKIIKQITKICVIGGVLHAVGELSLLAGKGEMLRILTHNEITAQEALDAISKAVTNSDTIGDDLGFTNFDVLKLKLIKWFST